MSNYRGSEWDWNISSMDSNAYYILVTVFDGTNSSKAVVGPINIKALSTSTTSTTPTMTHTDTSTTSASTTSTTSTTPTTTHTDTSTTSASTTTSRQSSGFTLITVLAMIVILFPIKRFQKLR